MSATSRSAHAEGVGWSWGRGNLDGATCQRAADTLDPGQSSSTTLVAVGVDERHYLCYWQSTTVDPPQPDERSGPLEDLFRAAQLADTSCSCSRAASSLAIPG